MFDFSRGGRGEWWDWESTFITDLVRLSSFVLSVWGQADAS